MRSYAEAQSAVVAITPAAMRALDAIRPADVGGRVKVFGLSESQIARRVKVIARAAGLADWEFFSGHSGRVGMARRPAAWPRTARPPTKSSARAAGSRAAAWSGAIPAASPQGRHCVTSNLPTFRNVGKERPPYPAVKRGVRIDCGISRSGLNASVIWEVLLL